METTDVPPTAAVAQPSTCSLGIVAVRSFRLHPRYGLSLEGHDSIVEPDGWAAPKGRLEDDDLFARSVPPASVAQFLAYDLASPTLVRLIRQQRERSAHKDRSCVGILSSPSASDGRTTVIANGSLATLPFSRIHNRRTHRSSKYLRSVHTLTEGIAAGIPAVGAYEC